MKQYLVSKPNTPLKGEIFLPTSKSIANRLLIMQALCEDVFTIHNISDSEDTKLLTRALKKESNTIDIGHAGTAMRFSTGYFAIQPGEWIITGSERMKNRPIAKLADALNEIGAGIEYLEKEGFPPIKTSGNKIQGGKLSIDGNISSQYISSLLMIAPCLEKGLELTLTNQVISASYIRMTLRLMGFLGIKHTWVDNVITIAPQKYVAKDLTVEADWSGASYWYQIVALADEADITIHGLHEDSAQGDAEIAKMFAKIGVNTEFLVNAVRLTKTNASCDFFEYDFLEIPDMAQTMAATLVMKGIPFKLTGTQSLRIKETDRVAALQIELGKYGADIKYDESGILTWDSTLPKTKEEKPAIDTYEDHRMALAFAPIALTKGNIIINEPEVVKKSYPKFWEHLKSVGFEVEEK